MAAQHPSCEASERSLTTTMFGKLSAFRSGVDWCKILFFIGLCFFLALRHPGHSCSLCDWAYLRPTVFSRAVL